MPTIFIWATASIEMGEATNEVGLDCVCVCVRAHICKWTGRLGVGDWIVFKAMRPDEVVKINGPKTFNKKSWGNNTELTKESWEGTASEVTGRLGKCGVLEL